MIEEVGSLFPMLLSEFRNRRGWSCNELARAVMVDPSYISRLERGEREPPRYRVVNNIAQVLGLGDQDRDRLLVAAGYAPAVIATMGHWDPTVNDVASVLIDTRLTEAEIQEFRTVVNALIHHWRFRLDRHHGR